MSATVPLKKGVAELSRVIKVLEYIENTGLAIIQTNKIPNMNLLTGIVNMYTLAGICSRELERIKNEFEV